MQMTLWGVGGSVYARKRDLGISKISVIYFVKRAPGLSVGWMSEEAASFQKAPWAPAAWTF